MDEAQFLSIVACLLNGMSAGLFIVAGVASLDKEAAAAVRARLIAAAALLAFGMAASLISIAESLLQGRCS